ncbi:unnamed protein product [Symbiodinium natans]|uniref:Microbial-type PARG catalytic domain-containing protein n=1 Tax=Symbiodinium natans TaxID=878477 RepID=A0A812LM51_9DINO|nr:unnamed protein product [Symbiodinium natans]
MLLLLWQKEPATESQTAREEVTKVRGSEEVHHQGADTYVEATVCGRPCEVAAGQVSSTYSSLECIVPNAAASSRRAGRPSSENYQVLPNARVISRNAGLATVATPVGSPGAQFCGNSRPPQVCFHGVGEAHFEVGHPTCVAAFDDDPEIVGGVDFGPFTNARVEKIRWHPLYDDMEADLYINSKIQIGQLSSSQTCWDSAGLKLELSQLDPGAVPKIDWTDITTITWPTTPLIGRYVRFLSPTGNCQLTEMQVIGQLVAPSDTCQAWRGGIHNDEVFGQAFTSRGLQQKGRVPAPAYSERWVTSDDVNSTVTFALDKPTVNSISPSNGTARGGTLGAEDLRLTGLGRTGGVLQVTTPRNRGIFPPSVKLFVSGWRYLDRWSLLDTWANQAGTWAVLQKRLSSADFSANPSGVDLLGGVLVFDNKDIHLQATYIWVKGGTMEIGTEAQPFMPVIGGKVLAVSNTQLLGPRWGGKSQDSHLADPVWFTYREMGDNAVEEGNARTCVLLQYYRYRTLGGVLRRAVHIDAATLGRATPGADGSFAWIRQANAETDRAARRGIAGQTEELIDARGFVLEGKSVLLRHVSSSLAGTRLVSPSIGSWPTADSWMPDLRCESKAPVFEQKTVLDAAEDYCKRGFRVAAVNAASAYHAGGGFATGGRHALEESMCIQSTLFPSLQYGEKLAKEAGVSSPSFVPPRRDGTPWMPHLPADGVLLSPFVEVFRRGTNEGYPFMAEPYTLQAVVSVAMPNRNPSMSDSPVDAPSDPVEYAEALKSRWRATLVAAKEVNADCVILPDAGCGVFKNDPKAVGAALGEMLCLLGGAFDRVVIASPVPAGRVCAEAAAQAALPGSLKPATVSIPSSRTARSSWSRSTSSSGMEAHRKSGSLPLARTSKWTFSTWPKWWRAPHAHEQCSEWNRAPKP